MQKSYEDAKIRSNNLQQLKMVTNRVKHRSESLAIANIHKSVQKLQSCYKVFFPLTTPQIRGTINCRMCCC